MGRYSGLRGRPEGAGAFRRSGARERLNKRLRAAFLEGAEEDSRRRLTANGWGGRIEESTGHPRGGPEPIAPSVSSPIT